MRRLPYLGAVAVLFFIVMWSWSMYLTPQWKIFIDYPSDLGLLSSPGHIFFNLGMMFFGAMISVYAYSMYDECEDTFYRLHYLKFIVSGIFMVFIGVFYEDIHGFHEYVSVSAFTLSAIATADLGIFFIRTKRKAVGVAIIAATLIFAGSGLFVNVKLWDNLGLLSLGLSILLISLAAWRFRFWEVEDGS